MAYNDTTIKRFMAKVSAVETDSGCLEWIASRTGHGYGQFAMRNPKRMVASHRMAWEISNGRILDRAEFVLHSCDNPACVNPQHLWIGTQDDNLKDAKAKGRIENGHTSRSHSVNFTHAEYDRLTRIAGLKGAEVSSFLVDAAENYGSPTAAEDNQSALASLRRMALAARVVGRMGLFVTSIANIEDLPPKAQSEWASIGDDFKALIDDYKNHP